MNMEGGENTATASTERRIETTDGDA